MTPAASSYTFESRCHDCNLVCLHYDLREVVCPECGVILRFECGLDADELIALAEKLSGSGKSARWGLRQLGYDTEEYEFKNIVDDLATCGLVKCQKCGFWEFANGPEKFVEHCRWCDELDR